MIAFGKATPERGEDAKRITLERLEIPGIVQAIAAMLDNLDACRPSGRHDFRIGGQATRFQSAIEMERRGARLLDQAHNLVEGVAPPQDQPRSHPFETGVQRQQATPSPPPRGTAKVPVIIDEKGNDRPTGFCRMEQRRIVVEPQVAAQPDEDGGFCLAHFRGAIQSAPYTS